MIFPSYHALPKKPVNGLLMLTHVSLSKWENYFHSTLKDLNIKSALIHSLHFASSQRIRIIVHAPNYIVIKHYWTNGFFQYPIFNTLHFLTKVLNIYTVYITFLSECVGSFGENCQYQCSVHCFNQTCDRFNGSCVFGCKETCDLGMSFVLLLFVKITKY